jgi:hypothetical protein
MFGEDTRIFSLLLDCDEHDGGFAYPLKKGAVFGR